MQFEAQRRGYAADFPSAEHCIVLVEGQPAGSLLCAELEAEYRIVDLAIVPPLRNRGLGASAIAVALERAAALNKPLTLSVRRDNQAALRLYHRLGFNEIAADALFIRMRRPMRK